MTASVNILERFDIYWVDLNPTKGSEIQKIRPCIIVSPNEMNEGLKTVIIVPLTNTIIDWPFRTTITISNKQSSAACDQLRTITKERLLNKIGSLSSKEKEAISDILQNIFNI